VSIRLRISHSGGQGRLIQIDADSATIGRDAECDVVLDSIFVSRFHARLQTIEDGYEISDLDSRNGVEVEGRLIEQPAHLSSGEAFNVGPFELQIVQQPALEQVTQDFRRPRSGAQPLAIDLSTHEVLIGSAPIRPPLSRLEFRLLALLDEAGGAVRERDELGDAVWGRDQWDLNMLHRLVHRLKEKIEPSPEQPHYIVTVPGVGYRLQSS
jgi:predicted component of type VI protein secretion system